MRLERDVTATLDEYFRGLEAAFPGAVERAADGCTVRHGALTMTIALADGPPRRLGALSLATLRVVIRIEGGSPGAGDEAHAAMLAHMDRVMQRGGG